MAFPWSQKKEPDETEHRHATPSPAHPLAMAAELLGRANEQIAAFLVHGQETDGPDGETLRMLGKKLSAISEQLDRLESRLTGLPPGPTPADGAPSASAREAVREILEQQTAALAATLAQLHEQLQSGFEEMARLVCPLGDKLEAIAGRLTPPRDAEVPAASGNDAWERAILGPDLAAAPALASARQSLVDGILHGDPGACALAGQLLVFQSTPAERLPQLLKEIGEAYYRWRPKRRPGTEPMEEALVRWLQRCCETAGIANTIELVHPGERFDASRHNAASRGVEITEVHGWIVLRDNGKVYMKATVSVR